MESDPSSNSSFGDEPLDVKPLRSLAPMFPAPFGFTTYSPSEAPPSFVCVTPFGPYPPGFTPFVPPSESQRASELTPQAANRNAQVGDGSHFPSSSFHTPQPFSVPANGVVEPGKKIEIHEADGTMHWKSSKKGKFSKSASTNEKSGKCDKASVHMTSRQRMAHLSSCTVCSSETEDSYGKTEKRKAQKQAHKRGKNSLGTAISPPVDGNRESVDNILMTFDIVRRRLLQLDDAREPSAGMSRRPDLKAGAVMMTRGLRVNAQRRIGAVPGVEVGDLFFFRFEMCLVGLHAPSMAGIDYMNVKFGNEEDPVALSIVSSGMYEDDDNDADVLIYSGQGGSSRVGKQIDDQKLERGNLALEKSSHRKNEIRVIRGMKDLMNLPNKIYVYDGLYRIQESWREKGKAGFSLFKYKLLRVPGQPDGSVVWKLTQQWKDNPTSRSHMILPDISSGIENVSICLVNDVDKEKGPTHFSYVTTVKYLKPISSMKPSVGCTCHSVCMPGDGNCCCSQRNGGYLPYSSNGLIMRRRALVVECGTSCPCSLNCRNRVSQKGIRFRFEVFKTRDRGWGLRSWDPIRAGSFICEYTGEIIDKIKTGDEDDEDEYMFQTAQTDVTALEPYNICELVGEEQPADWNETPKPLSFILSAKNTGNLSRFMNHSCSPNVFWQPVIYDHDDECYPHIMFYAMKHIPPMTELTYDYGLRGNESCKEEMSSYNGHHRRKKCLCGSEKCRGFFS
ncbi:hypothetical protein AAC387_Pa02g4668 [Persea americana]